MITPSIATPSLSEFKDRRTAIVVAGILEVVFSAGAWLLAALMAVGATFSATHGGAPMGSFLPGLVFYAAAGTAIIVLGIGTLRLRRWSRALWLVLSAGWLVTGVLGVVMAVFWLPAMFRGMAQNQPGPPEGVLHVIMAVMFVFMTFLMILVPLVIFLFYRSPHVKATFEAAQPQPGWTDACALPVLAAVVWLGLMAILFLVMPWGYGGFFPFFGHLLGGFPGFGLWWLVAVLSAVAAIGLYRGARSAWYLALVLVVTLGIAGIVTTLRADLSEIYRGMGMPDEQLEIVKNMEFTQPAYMVGWTLVGLIPLLVLLFWAGARLPSRR